RPRPPPPPRGPPRPPWPRGPGRSPAVSRWPGIVRSPGVVVLTIWAMAAFQPTLAPPGRLVRVGVVLDARGRGGRMTEVARMCDRAGIGAVWMDDSAPPGPPPGTPDPLSTPGGPFRTPPPPA